MPTLRNKVNKRKSDSFVLDTAKARKIITETKRNVPVPVPVTAQLKSLREAHAALIKENNENLKLIENLKLQVALLVHERSSKTQESKESQTDSIIDKELSCTECIFHGSNEEEMRFHVTSIHSLPEPVDRNKFTCNVCRQKFEEKWELMAHRKEKHLTSVKTCKYFLQGICGFDDKVCWFRHKQSDDQVPSFPQTLQVFKCSLCGKAFNSKRDFMEHRKIEHLDKVSECKEKKNGWCRFVNEECWFKHNDESKNSGIENSDMMKRLFDMMEAFSKRMAFMESQI